MYLCYHAKVWEASKRLVTVPATVNVGLWESPAYQDRIWIWGRYRDQGDSLKEGVWIREACYQNLPGLLHRAGLLAFHRQREPDEFLLLTACVLTFFKRQAAFKAPEVPKWKPVVHVSTVSGVSHLYLLCATSAMCFKKLIQEKNL